MKFSVDDVKRAFKQSGCPEDQHLAYARQLMRSLPLQLTTLLYEESHVVAFVFALLMSNDQDIQLQQISAINAV